jgi:aspartate aminotransferase-like enzyme
MAHLFIPGPVDVAPEVLATQTKSMLPHRSAEFEEIFHRTEKKARSLFGTVSRVFLTASSGTGLQEAAVRNLANERILSCVNGAFGARWHTVALNNGKHADKLEIPWGEPITPDLVTAALKNQVYEIITIVHNETSTGLQNPVAEIANAVQETSPHTLICVDAVSSLGGAPIEMDAWGLDFVLSSSQKALALPPGLGLGATSERALDRAATVSQRGWYFDFLRLEKHRIKNSTPTTPVIGLIYALDLQMERIHAEGLTARYTRHHDLALRVQTWAIRHGFGLFAAEGYRSQTVTTIINTLGVDVERLNKYLIGRGMRIANGYGNLKGETFRIAHMGETQGADIVRLLGAMDEYLSRQNQPQ